MFDFETPVLDDFETGVYCCVGGLVVTEAELEPDDFGTDVDGLIDCFGDGVGSAEDVDDVGWFG